MARSSKSVPRVSRLSLNICPELWGCSKDSRLASSSLIICDNAMPNLLAVNL